MCELKQMKSAFFKVHLKCSNIGWGADTFSPIYSLLNLEKKKKKKNNFGSCPLYKYYSFWQSSL